MPFRRIVEARSIITHGLGENAPQHEAYMAEFEAMVNQVRRLYPLWLSDREKSKAPVCEEETPTLTASS